MLRSRIRRLPWDAFDRVGVLRAHSASLGSSAERPNRAFCSTQRTPTGAAFRLISAMIVALALFLAGDALRSDEPTTSAPKKRTEPRTTRAIKESEKAKSDSDSPPADSAAKAAPSKPDKNAFDDADEELRKSLARRAAAKSETGKEVNPLMSGRKEPMRSKLVKERGGNDKSEDAVSDGLRWIAKHQQEDGSWRFDHTTAPGCNSNKCADPGKFEEIDNAATGLALLAFLGRGNTHLFGDFMPQVAAGLRVLVAQALAPNSPGDLRGSSASDGGAVERPMYAQGIATLALSEAYGLSEDPALKRPVELAIDFIVRAQGRDGGWRYQPKAPTADLSVSGWQIMALESARHSGIEIPDQTYADLYGLLNRLEFDGGRQYLYREGSPGTTDAMTASGLLARMFMRHYAKEPKNHPVLDDAINRLIKRPLSLRGAKSDMAAKKGVHRDLYYCYYAAQLFNQYDHPEWPHWNENSRDFLVKFQRHGKQHYDGSWDTIDLHSNPIGGRLYNTALAVLILEVYYRYLPIYRVSQK